MQLLLETLVISFLGLLLNRLKPHFVSNLLAQNRISDCVTQFFSAFTDFLHVLVPRFPHQVLFAAQFCATETLGDVQCLVRDTDSNDVLLASPLCFFVVLLCQIFLEKFEVLFLLLFKSPLLLEHSKDFSFFAFVFQFLFNFNLFTDEGLEPGVLAHQ